MDEKLALGIDGGGTKTVAWLARISSAGVGEILGKGTSQSSNVRAVGWEAALENLRQAIDTARSGAPRDTGAADLAVLAMAGASRQDVSTRLESWVKAQQLAQRVKIIHDAFAVVVVGTPKASGVALVAGTGSVAYAFDLEGNSSVTGGWGYWFGDEGSAFWLGQAALRAVSLSADSRGPETTLTGLIQDRLGVTEPRDMLTVLSKQGDERSSIAALAELVPIAAEANDPVAATIVEQGVAHLAKLVVTAAEKLSLGRSFPLALAGGVLCGSQLVREQLSRKLADHGITPSSIEVVPEPVQGCLRYACMLLKK